jgi:hypothetical protein
MKFKMSVELDNDAFAESLATELIRILREVAEGVKLGRFDAQCLDLNGNSVGQWVVGD